MLNQPRGGHIFNIDGAGSDGRPTPRCHSFYHLHSFSIVWARYDVLYLMCFFFKKNLDDMRKAQEICDVFEYHAVCSILYDVTALEL